MGALFAELARRFCSGLRRTCQNDFYLRTVFPCPLRKTKRVVGASHIDVAQQNIDSRMVLQNKQSLVAARGLDYPVSAIAKVSRDRHPNQNGFLNDQYRRGAGGFGFSFHASLTTARIAVFRLR